ncbi:MAG: hypothetical protein WAV05_05965 [Anaerolineales bacterium]
MEDKTFGELMEYMLNINEESHRVSANPGDSLLKILRKMGYFSVKHGSETGECGACTIKELVFIDNIEQSLPKLIPDSAIPSYQRVGKPDIKVEAIKLAWE